MKSKSDNNDYDINLKIKCSSYLRPNKLLDYCNIDSPKRYYIHEYSKKKKQFPHVGFSSSVLFKYVVG